MSTEPTQPNYLELVINNQARNLEEANTQMMNYLTPQADTGERNGQNVSIETAYDRLHMQLPFLEINPIVGAVHCVLIPTSGTSKTMQIPTDAQLVRFKSASSFYMGWQNLTAITGDILDGSAPALNPEGWYYCKDRKSVSLLSAANNQIITAEFFIQL